MGCCGRQGLKRLSHLSQKFIDDFMPWHCRVLNVLAFEVRMLSSLSSIHIQRNLVICRDVGSISNLEGHDTPRAPFS